MRFVIPTLIAGNVAILKHSSICVECALNIKDTLDEAGFPSGVFQIVIGDYGAGEALVQSRIEAVSVTGSVNTGKRVAELASQRFEKVCARIRR